MARQKSPEAAVLAFFETVEPNVAEVVLRIAKTIVARRQQKKNNPTPKPKPVPEVGGIVGPAVKNLGSTPRQRKLKDVPLPGMQTTVGD